MPNDGTSTANHDTSPHIDVIDALVASVPPYWATPPGGPHYPGWVRWPGSLAEFVASLVVHGRDGLVPGGPVVPLCDPDGFVTGMPFRIKSGAAR